MPETNPNPTVAPPGPQPMLAARIAEAHSLPAHIRADMESRVQPMVNISNVFGDLAQAGAAPDESRAGYAPVIFSKAFAAVIALDRILKAAEGGATAIGVPIPPWITKVQETIEGALGLGGAGAAARPVAAPFGPAVPVYSSPPGATMAVAGAKAAEATGPTPTKAAPAT
jgi:hypothetical protein